MHDPDPKAAEQGDADAKEWLKKNAKENGQ